MIKIVAKMPIKADKVEEFKAVAAELVAKSSAEEGNVFYTLNVSKADPSVLAFVECWKDQAAHEYHSKTEHFTRIFPILMQMCDGEGSVDFFDEVEY